MKLEPFWEEFLGPCDLSPLLRVYSTPSAWVSCHIQSTEHCDYHMVGALEMLAYPFGGSPSDAVLDREEPDT